MKNKWVWLVLASVVIVGALVYFTRSSLNNTQPYEGTELSGEASDFQLIDQNGSVIRLSDFQGRVIVLTFMDSECQDTCPLTAVHFREVYRQFDQKEAKQVVFLAVSVNPEASAVSDVLETTRPGILMRFQIGIF